MDPRCITCLESCAGGARALAAAALIALCLVGCGGPRDAAGSSCCPTAAASVIPQAFYEALTQQSESHCRIEGLTPTQPARSMGRALRIVVDPEVPLSLRMLSLTSPLSLQASSLIVVFDESPALTVRTIALKGSPARLVDANGQLVAMSTTITLGMDENGLSTIDTASGGVIMRIPGADPELTATR